jgi:lysozyme family protein
MTVDDILADVLKAEGGYVDDKRDAGGETNFGITIAVARANGYEGAMRDLPRSAALRIYRKRYVDGPGFSRLLPMVPTIAAELVDTGVNMGPPVATRFLQRALNALEDVDLNVDGDLGTKTVAAVAKFIARRGKEGERRLLAILNAQQGTRYLELAEGRRANRAFMFGWLDRIVS